MTLTTLLLVYSTFVFRITSQKVSLAEKEKNLTLNVKKYYVHNIFTINLK